MASEPRPPAYDLEALVDHIDNAVRRGLVTANVKGPLIDLAGPVTRSVVDALCNADPLTTDEVADEIERTRGFVRIGSTQALIRERFIPPGQLIDALLLLRRREREVPE